MFKKSSNILNFVVVVVKIGLVREEPFHNGSKLIVGSINSILRPFFYLLQPGDVDTNMLKKFERLNV